MGDGTKIEWTEATWNPVVGCSVASDGCTNCYAAREAAGRLSSHPTYRGLAIRKGGVPTFTGEVRCLPERLDQPMRWRRPRRIFVNSMSDLFHPGVPTDFIAEVVAVMLLARRHTFQVLTKRPNRMAQLLASDTFREQVRDAMIARSPLSFNGLVLWPSHLDHIWWGTSIEDQPNADLRLPHLSAIHDLGFVTWVSAEPLLAELTLGAWVTVIDWLVVGGESGPDSRPMHPAWARSLRDECAAASVPFLFKQWGEYRPAAVFDAPAFSGGRAFHHPEGGTVAASLRELSSKAFTSGRTRQLVPGDRTRGGVLMLDEDTVTVKVGKKLAGRELDGVTHDGYPETRAHDGAPS